jgi:hypothetical protein
VRHDWTGTDHRHSRGGRPEPTDYPCVAITDFILTALLKMADGHADRLTTSSQLLREATAATINSMCVHTGAHKYSLLGHIMYTLYLSFEVDINRIVQMIEQCLSMGADPNGLMYVEEDEHTFYTVYEFAVMISNLGLYPVDIMDSVLKPLRAAGGAVRPDAFDWQASGR